ncbi:MAG: hypothetical protein ACRCX8_20220 [Sarcina sp.]
MDIYKYREYKKRVTIRKYMCLLEVCFKPFDGLLYPQGKGPSYKEVEFYFDEESTCRQIFESIIDGLEYNDEIIRSGFREFIIDEVVLYLLTMEAVEDE